MEARVTHGAWGKGQVLPLPRSAWFLSVTNPIGRLNDGAMKCTDCGKVVESIKSQKGAPTPDNQHRFVTTRQLKMGVAGTANQ